MDKNNDIQVNKISKWDAAPKSIKGMHTIIVGICHGLTMEGYSPEEADNLEKILIGALSEVLVDYNKLEAKHQLDSGLISDYAEENARLKQKNEKASNNIRDLRRVLEENDIATYLNPVTVSWGVANVALQKKTEHFNTQLDNLREKLKEAEKSKENWHSHYLNMSDMCSRNEDDYEMLQRMLEKDGYTVEYDDDIDDETVHCRCTSDYIHRETTPDEVTLQFGRWTLTRPQTFSEARANSDVAILKKQIRDRDREIAELKKKCDELDKLKKDYDIILDVLHDANENWAKEIVKKDKICDELLGLREENKKLKEDRKRLNEVNLALRRTVNILNEEGYF